MHDPMATDREWLSAAVQSEAALDCDLQIGGSLPAQSTIDPTKLQHQLHRVKLYSLLFGELQRLLEEVDLGSGMEAAFAQGRRLIYARLQSLSPDEAAVLNALAAEMTTASTCQIQPQIRQQLDRLLSEADWQTMTATALTAMQTKLRDRITVSSR